jgi:hypothetical protein
VVGSFPPPQVEAAVADTSGDAEECSVVAPREIPGRAPCLSRADLPHEAELLLGSPEESLTGVRSQDWDEANSRAQLCERFLALRANGLGVCRAARELGRSASMFSGSDSVLARYQRGGVAALLPERCACGRKPTFDLPEWFVPAARFFWLLTNRTWNSGSVPEAIRRTISLPYLPVGWDDSIKRRLCGALGIKGIVPPGCPEELRERILARQASGLELVPERVARQITAPEAVVIQHRHPKNAELHYFNAPGTMMWRRGDPRDGTGGTNAVDRREVLRAGDLVEADDATINFPVCIPWTIGGDPCSEKYGARVGRFQWLVSIDAGSRFVTGYSYTARPRSSYRGEDVLSLIRIVCRQHGIPRGWRLEKGVWKSNLVTGAIRGLGSTLNTVHSPHNKPFIEGLFNTVWTKLSVQFPDAHLGRTRDEHQAANDLLESCKRGARDPRRHFPMLAHALAAFDECIREKNATPVESGHYGRWVPEQRWAEQIAQAPLARMSPESEWLFSPFVREWTVRGMLVGGRVPLFEDLSVPFDFSSAWMADFHGAKVRCYFDPSEPRCAATVVLGQDHGNRRSGEVLGLAIQINEVAGYARLVMGWGDDPTNAGKLARQQAAKALRREVRAILPRGGRGAASSEERDGVVATARIESQDGASRECAVKRQSEIHGSAFGPDAEAGSGINRDAGRFTENELSEIF